MGKIYTVVFNSAIAGDGSTNNERFFFDWSQLEEGRYKCSFTFMGAVGSTAPTGTFVPNLFIDLGQGAFTNIASSNVPTNANIGSVFSAMYIGSLEFRSFTTAIASYGYYFAGTTTNPPFFLDNRPRNSFINIMMLTNTSTQGIGYTPVPGAYTLTLQLEKIHDGLNGRD
jgi:hypothetical protein